MSPGTRWVTSTLTDSPSRVDGDDMADLGVHRLRGALGPVLVDEPETDRRRDDHPDDERRRVPRPRPPTRPPRRAAATATGCAAGGTAPTTRSHGESAPRSDRTPPSRADTSADGEP